MFDGHLVTVINSLLFYVLIRTKMVTLVGFHWWKVNNGHGTNFWVKYIDIANKFFFEHLKFEQNIKKIVTLNIDSYKQHLKDVFLINYF
jgi:hypothetical protein